MTAQTWGFGAVALALALRGRRPLHLRRRRLARGKERRPLPGAGAGGGAGPLGWQAGAPIGAFIDHYKQQLAPPAAGYMTPARAREKLSRRAALMSTPPTCPINRDRYIRRQCIDE